jgi:urea transport system ATP-binding protein
MTASVTPALLYLDNVTVSFDGFRALNALSLTVDPAEMRAIIGPNGAGKTTMMDVITGKTRPTEGTAMFEGAHDLTRLDEAQIATLGIGRKFQTPTVFDMHTVEDNLRLALRSDRRPFPTLFASRSAGERERVDALLERMRLKNHRKRRASELSHGQKQCCWRRSRSSCSSTSRPPA